MTKEDYNNIDVEYCAKCLSLSVKDVEGYPICQQCGNETFAKSHIDKHDELFKDKYGKSYLEW